jgi:hypothetical protein
MQTNQGNWLFLPAFQSAIPFQTNSQRLKMRIKGRSIESISKSSILKNSEKLNK